VVRLSSISFVLNGCAQFTDSLRFLSFAQAKTTKLFSLTVIRSPFYDRRNKTVLQVFSFLFVAYVICRVFVRNGNQALKVSITSVFCEGHGLTTSSNADDWTPEHTPALWGHVQHASGCCGGEPEVALQQQQQQPPAPEKVEQTNGQSYAGAPPDGGQKYFDGGQQQDEQQNGQQQQPEPKKEEHKDEQFRLVFLLFE
jgi:hypothetical protein